MKKSTKAKKSAGTKKAKAGGQAFKRMLKGAALAATAYGAKKLYDSTRKASKNEA